MSWRRRLSVFRARLRYTWWLSQVVAVDPVVREHTDSLGVFAYVRAMTKLTKAVDRELGRSSNYITVHHADGTKSYRPKESK